MKRLAALVILSALAATAAPARASVPTTIPFSGRLVQNGTPVTGTQAVSFRLFTDATGGTPVWQETQLGLTIDDGLIFAMLGASTAIDPAKLDGPLYLEVQLGTSDQPFSPRLAVASVPYAIHADVADAVGGYTADDLQARVTGACPDGQSIQRIDANGAVTCWTDQNTPAVTYTGGAGIAVTGTAIGLSSAGCATGDIWKWNGTSWACSPDLDTNTAYTGASPVAVSGTSIGLSTTGCLPGDVWKWNGSAWSCDPDANSTYTAGAGLAVSGSSIGLSSAGCAAGSVWKWSGSSWGCVADANTTYTASGPITVTGTTIGLSSAGCSAGYVMKWNGNAWTCDVDLDTNTTYTGASPITVSGTTIGLSSSGCSAGSVMKWSGTAWACAADANTGGTITGVTAGTGLTGGGTTGAVSLAVNPAAVQSRVAGACGANQAIQSIAQDGTVTCEPKSVRTFLGSYPLPVSVWSGNVSTWTQISTESFAIDGEINNASTFLKPGQTMQARLCVYQTDQSACQASNTWLHWRIRHRDNTSIVYYSLDVSSPCPNDQLYYQSCGAWVDQSVLAACTGGFAAGTCSLDFKNDTGANSITREAVIQLAAVN